MSMKRNYSKKLSKTIALSLVLGASLWCSSAYADETMLNTDPKAQWGSGYSIDMTTLTEPYKTTVLPGGTTSIVARYKYDIDKDEVIGQGIIPFYPARETQMANINYIDLAVSVADLGGIENLDNDAVNHVFAKLAEKYLNTPEYAEFSRHCAQNGMTSKIFLHIVDENDKSLRVGTVKYVSDDLKTEFKEISLVGQYKTLENTGSKKVTLSGPKVQIDTTGTDMKGVYAGNDGDATSEIEVKLTSDLGNLKITAGGNGIEAGKNGVINIPSLYSVTSQNGYILYAHDGGKIDAAGIQYPTRGNVLADTNGEIKLSGSYLNGNVTATNGGKVDLEISSLSGNIEGNVNLSITDMYGSFSGIASNGVSLKNAGNWNVKGASELVKLEGVAGGKITMGADAVKVGEFSGEQDVVYAISGDAITGGDFTIGKAETGSIINLTGNASGSLTEEQANGVLGALANKLVYSANDDKLSANAVMANKRADNVEQKTSGVVSFDENGRGKLGETSTILNMPTSYSGTINGEYPAYFKDNSTWSGAGIDGAKIALGDNSKWVTNATESNIASLQAGSSTEAADTINHSGKANVNIDKYSGHSNLNFNVSQGVVSSGDFIINDAEENSSVKLGTIYAVSGNADDKELANSTMEALANNLYYKGVNDNLAGSVELTLGKSGEFAQKTYTSAISYDPVTGQGTIGEVEVGNLTFKQEAKKSGTRNTINIQIRGDENLDKVYAKYMTKDDSGLKYTFTEDTAIKLTTDFGNTDGQNKPTSGGQYVGQTYLAIINNNGTYNDFNQSLSTTTNSYTIDLQNNNLDIDLVASTAFGSANDHMAGILAAREGTITIDNPGKLNISVGTATGESYYTAGLRASTGALNIAEGGHIVINNDNSWDNAVSIDVKGTNPWKIMTYTQALAEEQNGNTIDVKGLVDINAGKQNEYGISLFAYNNGSKVSVGGGRINDNIAIWTGCYDPNHPGDMPEVNVNVVRDENGKVSGLGNNPVMIDGLIQNTSYYNVSGDGGGRVNVALTTEDSYINGQITTQDTDAETNIWMRNGATFNNQGKSTITNLDSEGGVINQTENSEKLTINNFKGDATVIYSHDESDPTQIIGGDVNIGKAEEGSKVTMSTDNKGINTEDNKQVAAVMNAMAQKLTYAEAAETADNTPVNNLSGKVQIAEGLTASSTSIAAGDIKFDKDGKGTVDESTIENKAQKGDTETATMKAVKGALVSGALMMRAESNDLLKRMGDVRLAEEERGLWAKYYGGKYEMDKANAHVSYKAYQLGYDTKAGKNWTVGGAVSYNEGKSGKTELKNTAVGVYGTWADDKGQYIDLITKIGWLKNDFDVAAAGHQVEDSLKTTGMSMSAEYGKRFENKAGGFIEPNAELTFAHLNGKKVNAKADGGSNTLGIDQDDFNSLVGRLGLRIGHKSAKSSVYAKVALAHEFAGDFDVTFSAPGEPTKATKVEFKDTWGEFQIGGTTKVGKAGLLYANYQRSFAGDVKEKYRVDAGLRWSF